MLSVLEPCQGLGGLPTRLQLPLKGFARKWKRDLLPLASCTLMLTFATPS